MENCYKYNGDDNDFYDLAREMYERFKTLVEAIEEPPALDIEHASAEYINDQAFGRDESSSSFPDARARNISSVDRLKNDVPEQSQRAQSAANGSNITLGINRRRPLRGSSLSTEDVQRGGPRPLSGRRPRSRSRGGEKKSENDVNYEHSSADEIAGSDEVDPHLTKNYRITRASSTRANSKVVLSEEASEMSSQRRCLRTKRIPTDSDKGSEEEDYSEDSAQSEDESEGVEVSEGDSDSGGDVPAVGRIIRRPRTRSLPSRARQEPKKTMTLRQQSSETRTLRISLRAKSKPLYAEQDSDEDEDNGSHDSGGSDRNEVSASEISPSNVRKIPTRTGSTSIKNTSRQKSLRGRPKTDSLENVSAANSSEEESEGEISIAKENKRNGRPSRTTRSRSNYFERGSDTITQDSKVSCSRTSPRAKSRKLYADIDSYSESKGEDERSEDNSSSDEETNSSTRKRGLRQSDASDKKRACTQRKSPIVQKYPDLEKWGPITKRKIFSIGTAVLSKLVRFNIGLFQLIAQFHTFVSNHCPFCIAQRELDTLDLFSLPVLATHPSLAAAYKKKVKSPMDFQTIEKERLPFYTHIADLQDDLILTFRNCCEFNGEMTEYYNYAL